MNLNIQIESLDFPNNIIQPYETVRIIVTSLPGDQNAAISIEPKRIEEIHPVFTVGISKLTKKIIIVFRKKNIAKKDNIFASTIIRSEQFPNKLDDKHNTEMRNIPLYKPFPKDFNQSQSILENREILGKMEVRLALTEGC